MIFSEGAVFHGKAEDLLARDRARHSFTLTPTRTECGRTANLISDKYTCHHWLAVYLDGTKFGRLSRVLRTSISNPANRHHTHSALDGATTVTSSQAV